MQLGRHLITACHGFKELLRSIFGVAGHKAHQEVAGDVVDLCQQIGKVHVAIQILAVAIHVLSQQGDVLVPLSHQAADFF